METAYRDKAESALAQVQVLTKQNAELRAQLETMRAELSAARNGKAPPPSQVRTGGPTVVLGLAAVILTTLVACLVMYRQLGSHPVPVPVDPPAAGTQPPPALPQGAPAAQP